MRKWLWLGAAMAFLGVAGAWWYTHRDDRSLSQYGMISPVTVQTRVHVHPPVKNIDDEETSDAIEPSIFESGEPAPAPRHEPWTFEVLPLPRVVLLPGMEQPPRPDTEANAFLRMPYADEEEILAPALDPVPHLLDSVLRSLNLFQEQGANPAEEESEAKDVPEPATTPMDDPEPKPDAATEYHRMHPSCPYTGGCPYPYRR